MSFEDVFRQKYRVALHAARRGDKAETIAGLHELATLFETQYALKNGDKMYMKAQLSYWCDVFVNMIDIIQKYGLGDSRVRKFFGLPYADALPPYSNAANAKKAAPRHAKPAQPSGDISMDGLISEEGEDAPEEAVAEAPATEAPAAEAPAAEAPAEEPYIADAAPEEPKAEKPETGEGGEAMDPDAEADGDEVPFEDAQGDIPAEKPSGDAGAPTFVPDTLEGFIGQKKIVKTMLKEIAIAHAEGRYHLDNILLLGNPGLGKTTLMRLIAKALGVRFEWMDCSQYRNSQQSLKALQNFLMRVARDNEPVVIAFDEIHRLTEELQSSLLTLLESRVYVSPPDVNGNIKRIPIDEFTFIAATTNDQDVIDTIKDRCLRLKFQMEDYTEDELRQIYRNKVAAKGLTITDDAIETCIPRSRGSIRYINTFVEGMDRALYNEQGVRLSTNIDLQTALKFFDERGIDRIGLEQKDLEILHVLADDSTGAIGADTLSARVGLPAKKYLSEYEPYLLKIGFINVNGRGRSLTDAALEHLKGE